MSHCILEITKNENFIPHALLFERLENEFLADIELISDAPTFNRKLVKVRTALIYKQSKFNLLREESEGYSKLAIELTEHLPQPLDVYWANDKGHSMTHLQLSNLRTQHVKNAAKAVMRNLTCLIGTFDLDPMRVLDIILDVFISMVTDYWDFFLELLLISPWGPSTTEIDGTSILKANSIVAQVIGFKFSYYHRPNTKDQTAKGLLWIAALLVKHSVMELDFLYTHLGPDDGEIEDECAMYLTRIAESPKNVVETVTGKTTRMAYGALGDTKESALETDGIETDVYNY